jgi:hypothetical protein
MLQSFQWAGKPNRFSWPAHSIAKPPKSHLGRHIIVVLAVSQFNIKSRIIIELRQH